MAIFGGSRTLTKKFMSPADCIHSELRNGAHSIQAETFAMLLCPELSSSGVEEILASTSRQIFAVLGVLIVFMTLAYAF